MTTIRVQGGPAVDAVQRLSGVALGAAVTANFPAAQRQDSGSWVAAADWADATHAVWDDHRFTRSDEALAAVVDADPSKVPQDMTGVTLKTLQAAYATELAAWEKAHPNP